MAAIAVCFAFAAPRGNWEAGYLGLGEKLRSGDLRRSIAAAVCALMVAVLAVLLVPSAYSFQPGGFLPLAIIRDHHGPPEGWPGALMQREGGLPQGKRGAHAPERRSGSRLRFSIHEGVSSNELEY